MAKANAAYKNGRSNILAGKLMQIPVAIYAFCWLLDGLGFIDFSSETLFASADPSFMAAVFLVGIRAILVILAFILCFWGVVLWANGVQQREMNTAYLAAEWQKRENQRLQRLQVQETNGASAQAATDNRPL